MVVGKQTFPFEKAYFQGRALAFGEGIWTNDTKSPTSNFHRQIVVLSLPVHCHNLCQKVSRDGFSYNTKVWQNDKISTNLKVAEISIYPSTHLPTYLPVYLSSYLSIYVSMYLCIYVCMYLSIYLSIYIPREGYDVAIHYPNIYSSTYLLRKDLNRDPLLHHR